MTTAVVGRTAVNSRSDRVNDPMTAAQLLRLLGVHDKTITQQRDPLLTWCANHQPNVRLWQSLVANGYGLQLEQTVPGFKRPIPYRRITTAYGSKADMQL